MLESFFARFIIKHNLLIVAADHANEVFKKMFLESKIAEKYNCGCTFCASIIKNMATNAFSELIAIHKDRLRAISTDGSNDFNDKKIYSILITNFDVTKGAVSTHF